MFACGKWEWWGLSRMKDLTQRNNRQAVCFVTERFRFEIAGLGASFQGMAGGRA